jgi:asparagine synthase (glutamine-hydrolysing)
MYGLAGLIRLKSGPVQGIERKVGAMMDLIAHRGPDGGGLWTSPESTVGLGHRRLSIIDLSDAAAQPMAGAAGAIIVHNGEVYNYLELRDALSQTWRFRSQSDTECILAAYERYGDDCLGQLRGMFAFALWDQAKRRLFCARDRFGIKPFYYAEVGDILYFASEIKALLPFLPEIQTDPRAFAEYLTFQYTIGERTLFKSVKQLLPGHALIVENGRVQTRRYWDVRYEVDFDHSPVFFTRRLAELLDNSVRLHLRSDVPVGSYLSGGLDSSLIAILAGRINGGVAGAFHGKFTEFPGYDESAYARAAAQTAGTALHDIEITATDFRDHIQKVIYHLDHPVAGPGSFPQYLVSKLASRHVKVVLGGQGGDEIFGGYARYLLAYFEQCIKAAIDGTYKNGNFVVTAESIIPNLGVLREYKPLIREFWRQGLFRGLDDRYFRLVNRATDMADEIVWDGLDMDQVVEDFRTIFNNRNNVQHEAYFDRMSHFDFKCLLPALLQVEDRMSMAHGLESRVPLLDHPLIEFAATVPADVKFKDGDMKHLLKTAFMEVLPKTIVERRDKMGFPVPLKEWFDGELKTFVTDIFTTEAAKTRPFMRSDKILQSFTKEAPFSRKTWGLLSLELWHQIFHDRAAEWRAKSR